MKYKIKRYNGFTLLEVMIVVAILGILAAIAIPSYQRYITGARLEDAKTALSQNYLYMNKIYAKNNAYRTSRNDSSSFIETANLPVKYTGGSGNDESGYSFTVTDRCTSSTQNSTENTFCIKAKPKGAQVNASGGGRECETLKVNQAGQYFIGADNIEETETTNDGFVCFNH